MPERMLATSEDEMYTENLAIISKLLNKNGIVGFCVGGLPIKASLGRAVTARRPENGTITDFDYLALGPDKATIQQTVAELKNIAQKRKFFPDIGIESAVFQSESVHSGPFKLLSGVRVDPLSDKIFLFYKKIEVEVPGQTMKPQLAQINGVPFFIPPLKTLWWRAVERGGAIKIKDDPKLQQLATVIRKTCPNNPADQLYTPHLDFILKINQRYPVSISLYQTYWDIDRRLNGRFSGSSILYGLIALFRK